MTASIIVLTEEPSARIVIDQVSTLCAGKPVQVLQHAGKNELERSITRKINGWRSPIPTRFIVTRDLDKADRDSLRSRLLSLVPQQARDRTKIRIVIPELEVWYLGEPEALMDAGLIKQAAASRMRANAKFRNLCHLQNAKFEFKKLVGEIGQIAAAEAIAPFLSPERNASKNFQSFVEALRWAERGIADEASAGR